MGSSGSFKIGKDGRRQIVSPPTLDSAGDPAGNSMGPKDATQPVKDAAKQSAAKKSAAKQSIAKRPTARRSAKRKE